VSGTAALPLPFGATTTTGNYTVVDNVIYLWDPPLLLDLCVRSSRDYVALPGVPVPSPTVQGVAIGSAGFGLGRICVLLGVVSASGRRTAYLNISDVIIGLDNCYLQSGTPPLGGLGGAFPPRFPNQVTLSNYIPTDANAIKSCPDPRANDMPAELLGSAATQGQMVPWSLLNALPPALVAGQTALAPDGLYQEFLSTSVVLNYCVFSATRLTVAAPQGTATPPRAPAPSSARGAAFGWWSVRFGDRLRYPAQSICALYARVPSVAMPGTDDLVWVMGAPGFPVCPTAWDGSAGSNNGTYIGFYPTAWGPAATANGARRLALAEGLLKLSVGLAAGYLAFDALAPRGEAA